MAWMGNSGIEKERSEANFYRSSGLCKLESGTGVTSAFLVAEWSGAWASWPAAVFTGHCPSEEIGVEADQCVRRHEPKGAEPFVIPMIADVAFWG